MASDRSFLSLASQASSVGRPLTINVSSKVVATREWTVLRQEKEDGPTFPIRLNWSEPTTGLEVWSYLMERIRAGDREWQRYRVLEAYPTKKGER